MREQTSYTPNMAVDNTNQMVNQLVNDQLAGDFGQNIPNNAGTSSAGVTNNGKDLTIAKYNSRCTNDDLLRINSQ